MTAPIDLSPAEEADALAAEYVLGVLSLQDRLAAEARIKVDVTFAKNVANWENHFEAFNDGYESTPAPDLMDKIEARIFGKQPAAKRSWWGFFAGAGVAAILAIAVIFALPPAGNVGPTLTASLVAETQELAFNATYTDGKLTLDRVAGNAAQQDKDYELWLIVGDAAPVSLGVIQNATTTRTLAGLTLGSVLAISLESKGGSTNGKPSEVLMVGKVARS